MRSASGERVEQQALPFDTPAGGTSPAPRRTAPARAERPSSYRLGRELVRTRGWPEGSELVISSGLRPAPGDVVLVRERDVERAGVFQRRFGRSVLVTDRGIGWIGPQAEVLGVVTLVGAALDGMPS